MSKPSTDTYHDGEVEWEIAWEHYQASLHSGVTLEKVLTYGAVTSPLWLPTLCCIMKYYQNIS